MGKLRVNYMKVNNKWVRRMEYFDIINNKWEEFNKIDFFHLEKLTN